MLCRRKSDRNESRQDVRSDVLSAPSECASACDISRPREVGTVASVNPPLLWRYEAYQLLSEGASQLCSLRCPASGRTRDANNRGEDAKQSRCGEVSRSASQARGQAGA